MCGYIGIYSKNPTQFKENMFDGALKAIHHRGPDSNSKWFDPSGHVAFGYVRLGLVGLSNGTQPIVSDEGDLVLMVNGEFYDYRKIKTELEEEGCQFKTSSDSEIAMHLYRKHGLRGLKFLRGDFSVLLFDRKKNIMIAMRDRMGVKPLYYTEYNGAWYFGSEIKALLAAGVPAQWDHESYTSRSFILRDGTVFEGIRSVKPGCWIVADTSGIQVERYWDWEFSPQNNQSTQTNEIEIISSLRNVIEESVRLRLHADVPVGVSLSGGLDSSAMLGISTHLQGKPLDAFHLSFKDAKGYDESYYAELVAKHNNANLHVISVTPNDLADDFERSIWHTEFPFTNAHSIAKYKLCKFVQDEGFRAIITGEGADEVFGGYPHNRRDMVLYNHEHQDPAVIEKLQKQIKDSARQYGQHKNKDIEWIKKELSHGISWLESQANLFDPLINLYNEEVQRNALNSSPYRQFFDRLNPNSLGHWDPVNQAIYMVAKSSLPNIVLTSLGDRMEMAGSLEGRPPLLDHKIVELACNLPVSMKIRGETEKYALREAMRPYVPEAIYTRKKQYFRAPPASLQPETKLFQLINDMINSKIMLEIPFFDAKKVRQFTSKLRDLSPIQQISADHILMEITGLCLLHKNFGIR